MTEEEKIQWDKLYQYVRKEIMLYDDNQALPKNIVLGLKGLKTGKAVENKTQQDKANYTYDIILLTFKFCKSTIFKSISGKNFKSDLQKFIYIKVIVENNLNDIYNRMNKAKRLEEKIETTDMSNIYYDGANYQSKQNSKTNEKYDDLW